MHNFRHYLTQFLVDECSCSMGNVTQIFWILLKSSEEKCINNLDNVSYLFKKILSSFLYLKVELCFLHVDLIADTSASVLCQNWNASTTI